MQVKEALRSYIPMTLREIYQSLGVFFVYFLGASAGLYVYYTYNTSPALIWPPVGIALAAAIFYGYRVWLPIFFAHFLATSLQSEQGTLLIFIASGAYALQTVVGLYVLRALDFKPRFNKLANALIIVFIALVVTAVVPTIVFGYQYLSGTLTVSPLLGWTRSWAAGIFSILVFTTCIVSWYPWQKLNYSLNGKLEIILGFLVLTGVNYLLFWTKFAGLFGITVIFFMPAVLIWLALRLHVRWLTLAVLWSAAMAIPGSILTVPADNLSAQLLASQIYIALVAAMVLIFVSIVEERREAYQGMRDALEAMIQSDRTKTEFIAVLAHELRNPLAPLVSSLELLKLQPQSREAIVTINNAQEHTTMIRRLLDDLLDTARLSQNKITLKKEMIPLRKVIDQSAGSVAEFYKRRGHTLSISMPKEEIILNADPVRLKQIIINLLNNAGKYTKGKGRIDLSVDIQNTLLIIQVSDNGIGIEREMLTSIFEPFKQAAQMSKQGAGLGIGLFLSKSLVQMHGGQIFASSEGLGKGSTFTLHIPLIPQGEQSFGVKKELTYKKTKQTRILIVDDNEHAAIALQKLLEHHGHTVDVAFSGANALEKAFAFKPKYVLLDLGMPDMDGYEVARELHKRGFGGVLIALTGYGQESDREKSKEAGFDHHLVKPVKVEDVLTVLE